MEGGDDAGDHPGKLCFPVTICDVEAGDTIAIEIKQIDTVGNGAACIDGPLQSDEGFRGVEKDYFIPLQEGCASLPAGICAQVTPSTAVKQATGDLVAFVQSEFSLDYNAAYFWVTHFAHARNGAIWVSEENHPCPATVTLHLPKPIGAEVGQPLTQTS